MKSELSKRVFTSIILLIFLIIVNFTKIFIFVVFILCFWICFEFSQMFKKIFKTRANYWIFQMIAITYTFLIFAPISIVLHDLSDGPIFFLYLLLICIFTDIGGYIFGKLIGGKKITSISPNKTYSGSLGSFFLALIVGYLYYQIQNNLFLIKINIYIFIMLISLVSQIGDLLISFLKRKAKIKDTGSVLPGHGGVLDRIDGILLAVPIGLLLINVYS